jgi:hypothetical protein
MPIRINLDAMKTTQWHEYATRFLLGGAFTLMTGLIAQHFGPVIGGLFLAFPAIFPSGATLIDKHERDKKRRAGISRTIRGRLAAAIEARGAAMGSLALAAFGLLVWKLLPSGNAATVLVAAFALWLSLAILLWRARKLHVYLN